MLELLKVLNSSIFTSTVRLLINDIDYELFAVYALIRNMQKSQIQMGIYNRNFEDISLILSFLWVFVSLIAITYSTLFCKLVVEVASCKPRSVTPIIHLIHSVSVCRRVSDVQCPNLSIYYVLPQHPLHFCRLAIVEPMFKL